MLFDSFTTEPTFFELYMGCEVHFRDCPRRDWRVTGVEALEETRELDAPVTRFIKLKVKEKGSRRSSRPRWIRIVPHRIFNVQRSGTNVTLQFKDYAGNDRSITLETCITFRRVRRIVAPKRFLFSN